MHLYLTQNFQCSFTLRGKSFSCCNTACCSYEELLWNFVINHSPCCAYSDTHCFLLPLELAFILISFIILAFSIRPSVTLCLSKNTHYIYRKKTRHYSWMDPSCESIHHQFKCSLSFPNVALNLRSVALIFHFCFHNLHLKYIIPIVGRRGSVECSASQMCAIQSNS